MLEKREAREVFILAACAMGMHATHGTEQAEHVRRLKSTAEALADELGLKPAGEEPPPGDGDAARWREDYERQSQSYARVYEELDELRTTIAAAKLVVDGRLVRTGADVVALAEHYANRIRDLEQDLEKATAPKARAK